MYKKDFVDLIVLRAPWSDFNFRGHFEKVFPSTFWILIFWGFGSRTIAKSPVRVDSRHTFWNQNLHFSSAQVHTHPEALRSDQNDGFAAPINPSHVCYFLWVRCWITSPILSRSVTSDCHSSFQGIQRNQRLICPSWVGVLLTNIGGTLFWRLEWKRYLLYAFWTFSSLRSMFVGVMLLATNVLC